MLQERDEVVLLLVVQVQGEPSVVEIDGLVQVLRRSVVEVRRPRREPAQDRSLEAADVVPLPGDECTARVGRLDRRAGLLLRSV